MTHARGAYQGPPRGWNNVSVPINSSTARRCYPSRCEPSWRHATLYDWPSTYRQNACLIRLLNEHTRSREWWIGGRFCVNEGKLKGRNLASRPVGDMLAGHPINPSNVCWCPGALKRLAAPWRTDDWRFFCFASITRISDDALSSHTHTNMNCLEIIRINNIELECCMKIKQFSR